MPACVKLSLVSGVNFAANIADTTIGKKPENTTLKVSRESGLTDNKDVFHIQRSKDRQKILENGNIIENY